jgi:enoyl-CoA hydratase/carnithine racemase
MAPRLDSDGDVGVLVLGDGENRLTPDMVAGIHECLDEVERGPLAALVTAAEGKIWSNGLDTAWFAANPGGAGAALQEVERLFARVLTLGVPTVAALQGHVFAGGAMLALSHDLRVMRADRGFFCLPEIDLGVAFTPGMFALLTSRMSPPTAHAAMVLGRRFGGPDALAAGIVDECAAPDEVLGRAVALAGALAGKDRVVLSAVKRRLYERAVDLLGAPPGPETIDAICAIAARVG